MTRIIAGSARGRHLVVPRGGGVRPTADRAREALFSALAHRGWLDGTRVLDLYAGTGALGLEAASRGAAHVRLVERAPDAVAACRRNAAAVAGAAAVVGAGEGAVPEVVVTAASVSALLGGPRGPEGGGYDLVLLDPPYDLGDAAVADVLGLLEGGWLVADALVVVERGARSPSPAWPAGWEPEERRRYGEAALWLARRRAGPRPPSGDGDGDGDGDGV